MITDESPAFINAGNNPLNLEFSRYGLLDGEVEVSFKGISSAIIDVPDPLTLDLEKFETHDRTLNITIDPQITYGSTVQL